MEKIILISLAFLTLSAHADCSDGITPTTPASRFTINNDNTVTDSTTGLTWMRCSLGQTSSDCSGGSAQRYSWADALNEITNHHHHSGWRLPNIKELRSIVERKCYKPAINVEEFPNTQINDNYWTSSPSSFDGAWYVSFDDGNDFYNMRSRGNYVRLVRGGL